jgi:hypothetical protein
MMLTNRFILVKGEKGSLRDKRATPTKKAVADTKGLVKDTPAGMHYGDAREWSRGLRPGWRNACHAGGLSYSGWLGIVSPQLRCTNTQTVVCQSHLG